MKKKFLCLILAVLMLPAVLMFTGCGDKGYQLSSFKSDYESAFNNLEIIDYESNKITFDYSNYSVMNQQVNSATDTYGYLKNYNEILNNMMAFSNRYADEISKGSFDVDAETRDRLKLELDNFAKALNKVDTQSKNCADYIQLTGNAYTIRSLVELRMLFESYSEAFQAGFNLNSTLAEIYFNDTKIKDYTTVQDFSPLSALIDSKFDARCIQQIVYTSQILVEIYLDSPDFADSLSVRRATYFGGNQGVYTDYVNTIYKLRKTYTSQNVETISYNQERLKSFKENMIKLNNYQAVYNNDVKYYRMACNEIRYNYDNGLDVEPEVEVCVEFIYNFSVINSYYNKTLTDILTNLGV